MYKKGDTIVYGSTGVCDIIDITDKKIGREKRKYYLLKPRESEKNTIFVPVDNPDLVKRMRDMHTAEDLYRIIDSAKQGIIDWPENTNERSLKFKTIIAEGNTEEIIKMVRRLNSHRMELEEEGGHLSKSDERVFKEAVNNLYNEFSGILNIEEEVMIEMILT